MITYEIAQWNTTSTSTLEEVLKKTKYTILYFYPKNDTPWCTIEANDFTALLSQFEELWTQILWVSRDSVESHCKFITKYDLKPIYLSDPDLILHKKYEARGEKNNYWKIVTWVIRWTVLLDQDWKIIHHWKNIRAKGHAQRVVDFIAWM